MKVQVANGNHLVSQFECPGFSWKVGGFEFQTTVRTLPMGGYDLVLGVDWLGSLGKVTFDYKRLTLEFQYKGQMIILQGNSQSLKPRIQQMTAKAFIKSCQRQGNGFLYLINEVCQPTGALNSLQELNTTEALDKPKQLQALLHEYEDIFQPPTGLPPHRPIEHNIDLKEGAQPFSVKGVTADLDKSKSTSCRISLVYFV